MCMVGALVSTLSYARDIICGSSESTPLVIVLYDEFSGVIVVIRCLLI